MTEPREIKPFELDGKSSRPEKDFRLKRDEDAPDPKALSVLTPADSSDSGQIALDLSGENVIAEKVSTETQAPASSPETSPGKTKQPAKL